MFQHAQQGNADPPYDIPNNTPVYQIPQKCIHLFTNMFVDKFFQNFWSFSSAISYHIVKKTDYLIPHSINVL